MNQKTEKSNKVTLRRTIYLPRDIAERVDEYVLKYGSFSCYVQELIQKDMSSSEE
jgi:hypothetical protein